jgi:CheY-like chemotaxis protein
LPCRQSGEASNAREAIAVLERKGPIDLVFTDVKMPGEMDGIALARFLKTKYPHIKVLVTSGHVRTSELLQDFGSLIDKPYERGRIVERIRNALSID